MNFHACQATYFSLSLKELHEVASSTTMQVSHSAVKGIKKRKMCLKNGMKFIIKYRLFLNMHHHRSLLCRHGPCDLCVSAHTWDIIVSLHLILKNFTVKQTHFIQDSSQMKPQTLLWLFSNFKLQKIGFLVVLVAEDDKAPNGIFTTVAVNVCKWY